MDAWSHGRAALVGDAAFCPSLLTGQGAALAMISADVLAGDHGKDEGRHEEAFAELVVGRMQQVASKPAYRFSGRYPLT